ncbi:MAG: DUF2207 domain-containing protein [Woeseiaceae bacterium]|nr:DUF2207 domain-containing protein [Woeseiaceae bacterium]
MIRSTLILLLLSFAAHADERILSFHSDIVVNSDASILVTETIRVRAEGRQIRRGIYRSIPTEYFDKTGNRHQVSIEPLSVLRDGEPEAFHTKKPRDRINVYFGRSDSYLETGVYEYSFRYRAYRMLGFFENHDELYWNVTGFDWRFPIDEATASVKFEFDVSGGDLVVDAYTGAYGQRGRDYKASRGLGPSVEFASNSPLSPVNGLTIVVAWPKGLVEEPNDMQRAAWFLNDNRHVMVALAGLIVLLAYYIPVWRKFGRDPDEGPIMTRYEPPHGYSPASLRYINQMYYDGKVMTAAIVNLAVKGYLEIDHSGKKHSLSKLDPGADAPPLAPGERELFEGLFKESSSIELDNKNHKIIGAAKNRHKRSLKDDYKGKYFNTNGMLNLPGFVIVAVFTVATFAQGLEPTFASIGAVITLYVAMVIFAILMKRPTMRGRKLLDQMSGFRDYLDVAEKEELDLRNPPDKTPQLFERYLPYALALGVDQRWAEKFASVLASIRDQSGNAYQPAWYHGNWNGISSMSSDLSGSFSTAVSHSASPPGSSSGSGGGGFSGGGGGGGGGGGW